MPEGQTPFPHPQAGGSDAPHVWAASTLLDVKAALEAAGIEFIGTPDDSPGIRLRPQKSE